MARSYSNVTTSIWQDPEFRALSMNAQRLYLMLLTQPDISSCGILPVTLKRWARNASDSDPDSLSIALTELADSLFVVVDWDVEELLVRTFVKWDGGSNNAKRLPAILSAACAIQSTRLMQVAAYELSKLGVAHQLPVTVPDSLSDALSDSPSDTPRVGVTLRTRSTNPQPTTRNPHSATPSPQPSTLAESKDSAGSRKRAHRLPDDWQPSPDLIEFVKRECPNVDGRIETQNFCDYWHAKAGKDATKLDWSLTYRKWMRTEQQRAPANRPPATRSTTDDRVRDALTLAARLAEREASESQPDRKAIA